VKKAVSSIWKGIKTVFKKITSSTIGKVLLAAAAIYLGGAAFGMWESPFAAVNGAFTKGAELASQQLLPGQTVGVAGQTGGTAAGGSSVVAETGKAVIGQAPGRGAALPVMQGGASEAAKTGFLAKLGRGAKAVGKYAGEHELLTAATLSGIASMTGEDESDLMAQRRKDIAANFEGAGDIDLGFNPTGNPLKTSSGTPVYGQGGILQRLRQRSKFYGNV
tara:strand:+ start:1048 stop:1707 length:660 start_codon:yes stop_codon:yes gene_type:complete